MAAFNDMITSANSMSVTQPYTTEIVRRICSAGGTVTISKLCDMNFFTNPHAAKFFFQRQPNFFRLEGNKVYVHTSAEICDEYEPKQDNCRVPGCTKFHLCKHFVTGSCKFGKRCTSSHDLHTYHNRKVLEAHQLLEDDLDDDMILQLLKLSCVQCTVPDVCSFYNTRGCKNETTCTFLHVCLHYIKDDCKFGGRCRLSHNILDQQPRKVLTKFGMDIHRDPHDLVRMIRLKKTGRDSDAVVNDYDDDDDDKDDITVPKASVNRHKHISKPPLQVQPQTSTDNVKPVEQHVCIFYLGGKCNYNEKCFNLHTEQPFQWQWHSKHDGKWEDFDSNQNVAIEKAFCNANKNAASVNVLKTGRIIVGKVDFSKYDNFRLLQGTLKDDLEVRRIGTRFESQGWRRCLTTWIWYWKDDDGNYIEYGKQSSKGTEAGICSKTIEDAYRSYCSGEHVGRLHFQTGRHRYEMDFTTMKQENQLLGKKRKVKRRPEFATNADVNGRIKRQANASTALSLVPATWDKDVMPETVDFQLCSVAKTTGEYRDISRRFQATLPIAFIVSIKRVQNVELWEEFCRKRGKMEKKNRSLSVREELLFHGTTDTVLYAICQQNFDHRLSGTRVGAKYGQGAYFHKSAKYSDGFAKSDASGCKRMFQARVLVGSCAKGSKDLRRPPPKDPRKPLEDFYDTCVDNSANPSIFVTFENNQVYPEYIITYSTSSGTRV